MAIRKTLNIAHRGARSVAPENTLVAARKGLALGADMWETDIAVTADEALILMHDGTLERTTDARKVFPDRSPWNVADFSLDEIHQLDPGAHFLETDPFAQIEAGAVSPGEQVAFVCQGVPTLEEALLYTKEAGWRVDLELKPLLGERSAFPLVERTLDVIERVGIAPEQVVISSFNHDYLQECRQRRPDIEVQALVGDLPVRAGALAFETYNGWDQMVDEDQVRTMLARGARVNIYTVNDPAKMRRWIAAGVHGIFTDFPQRLAAVLAETAG